MSTPVFLANLDRYGRAGHQTARMLTPFLLAHFYKGFFISSDYKFFAYRMNDIFDFYRSERSFRGGNISNVVNVSSGFRKPHGNDDFDTSSIHGLKHFLSTIDKVLINTKSKSQALIQLPFDQPPGLLLRLLNNNSIYDDLAKLVKINIASSTSQKILAIHIRRGDVNENTYPEWWIPGHFYCQLLHTLDQQLESHWKIIIVSQEVFDQEIRIEAERINNRYVQEKDSFCKDSSRVVLEVAEGRWSNTEEVSALKTLIKADVIIGSISSFACLASRLGNNKYILVTKDVLVNQKCNLSYDLKPMLVTAVSDKGCINIAKFLKNETNIFCKFPK